MPGPGGFDVELGGPGVYYGQPDYYYRDPGYVREPDWNARRAWRGRYHHEQDR